MTLELTTLRGLIMDMDGVLYHGDKSIQGGREFLDFLHAQGIRYLLLTNNSTLTSEQYVTKLAGMNMHVTEADILTSADATASYLAHTAAAGTRMFVIGEGGLHTCLQKHGFVLVDDTDVAYVVVGFDRQLTWEKLATATRAIRAGAHFVASNPDRTFPSESGLVPGAGATLAALEAATDVDPLVIGKPETAIFQQALQRLGVQTSMTGVVGDGLQTDILGGKRAGLATILLLSGVTNEQQLAKAAPAPDLIFSDIAALHRAWQAALQAHGQA